MVRLEFISLTDLTDRLECVNELGRRRWPRPTVYEKKINKWPAER